MDTVTGWTDTDDRRLIELRASGTKWKDIADAFDRPLATCSNRFRELRRREKASIPAEAREMAQRLGLRLSVEMIGFSSPGFWLIGCRVTGRDIGTYVPTTASYWCPGARGQSDDWRDVLKVFAAEADRISPARARSANGLERAA